MVTRVGTSAMSERNAHKIPCDVKRVLIVGAGDGGKLVVREMQRNRDWGFTPVGFVDDHPEKVGSRIIMLPVIGTTAEIPDIVQRERIDVIVLAVPSASEVVFDRIRSIARRTSARVLTMPSLEALLRGSASVSSLRTITMREVLGRPEVAPNIDYCRQFIRGRRVLITGAAGSIGHELASQVCELEPGLLIVVDTNESGIFDLQCELGLRTGHVRLETVVGSVTNARRLSAILAKYKPEIIFHAAAYKHVPMMEEHPEEAAMVNAVGTYLVAQAAVEAGVDRFVLVSTDKAVNPTNVMGASKRLAELAVQIVAQRCGLSACSVRFGNVLGSRGSVIPLFERQIQAGGPVTVTDPAMKRFFMTIPEAAGLIIQAGAFGSTYATYVLDMGDEISILRLAERMIELHGHRPGDDIQIIFTGTRPGEKLHEELSFQNEMTGPTDHPKIRYLRQNPLTVNRMETVDRSLQLLAKHVQEGDQNAVRELLFRAVEIAEAKPPLMFRRGRPRKQVASRLNSLDTVAIAAFAQRGGSDV